MALFTIATIVTGILLIINPGNSAVDKYAAARIESCRGCSLNRLPEIKKFIYEDVPLYENIEFKPIPGALPELVLLQENFEEVERIQLSQLSREDCNELLISKGFKKKSTPTKDEI